MFESIKDARSKPYDRAEGLLCFWTFSSEPGIQFYSPSPDLSISLLWIEIMGTQQPPDRQALHED